MRGGNARRRNTPPLNPGVCGNPDFSIRRDPVIAIGPVNESIVTLEGKEYLALLDSGAQPSGISLKLAKKLGLKIYQLDTLLDIEGFGGNDVPYLGYVEAQLQVKEISGMDEDSLFLVVSDSNYTKRVPISTGTVHIERCLQLLKEEEIPNLTHPWGKNNLPKTYLK